MKFDVRPYQARVDGSFKWYFQYSFYCNGVDRLCPTVRGFATQKEATAAARSPEQIEAAESYMNSVFELPDLRDRTSAVPPINPISYTVPPDQNIERKRYAKIAPGDQKPGDSYVVVAFKNETVRRAANVRATEQGYKFWDAKRKEISVQQVGSAPLFENSNIFRKYLRHTRPA